ncbi:histidine phosphatase family protein [Hymenobacter sp. UYCo722]|uniref:histidine phosphatase family protein n=1 Tax=Hymenobacter sp. UYCo722 TaxID=3156335 RepID=UPI003396960D
MPKLTDSDKARLYLISRLHPFAPQAPAAAPAPVLRIVIIRHGEKPAEGDNLSCVGLNRALALPAVLNRLMPSPPNLTFVPVIGTDKEDTTRVRMLQTVMPYAVQHNLTINSNFMVENTKAFARQLRQLRGTVLVVWEHNSIVDIAKDLGIDDVSEWPDTDFDSIWTISFSGGGAKGKAKHPVLAKSRQHIHPSPICPD